MLVYALRRWSKVSGVFYGNGFIDPPCHILKESRHIDEGLHMRVAHFYADYVEHKIALPPAATI